MTGRLFDTGAKQLSWQQFSAEGFKEPVCGIIFPSGGASCGIPLGGIGTGCMDLDTDGTLGRASIFNSFVPPRELNTPLLAIVQDDKVCRLGGEQSFGVTLPSRISYWGHYPVADLEIQWDAPIEMGLRSWSPFLPGDSNISNTPGAVFEVRLRNRSDSQQSISIITSFPGPAATEAKSDQATRQELDVPLAGVQVCGSAGVGFALGVIDANLSQVGGSISPDGTQWANVTTQLPTVEAGDLGASLASDLTLGPGEEKTVRFVLAWYAPRWIGNEDHHYWHKYRDRFDNAAEVAHFLAMNYVSLLSRITNWQAEVYEADELPIWLRDQLVNVLHTITEDSFWASNSIPPDNWGGETGIFGMTESPRTTPHVAIPSDYYGSLPIVFFFPDLMRSLLRAYAHFQLANGEIALGLGSGTDLQSPIYHCLHTTNACNFVDLVDRLWQRDQDEGVLREFYPAVKKAIDYAKTLDRDGDGLLDLDPEPGGNQFYGAWLWHGTATHPNGYWLAALKIGQRMAEHVGDIAFARDCNIWFQWGSRSLEEKLWNECSYLLYRNTATGQQSDTVLANQLAGQWLARLHGLEDVFPSDRVHTVIKTVKRLNLPASQWGALNAIRCDGTIDKSGPNHSTEIFPAENIIFSATCCYHGDTETGTAMAERVVDNIVLRQRVAWDMPNMFDPKTGEITHGTDFFQMMIQWAIPPAMTGQDIASFSAAGGLVDRILKAADEQARATQ